MTEGEREREKEKERRRVTDTHMMNLFLLWDGVTLLRYYDGIMLELGKTNEDYIAPTFCNSCFFVHTPA